MAGLQGAVNHLGRQISPFSERKAKEKGDGGGLMFIALRRSNS